MVKSKVKPKSAVVSNHSNCKMSLSKSSNSIDDIELAGEDDWVVVKKQKVTILIPRLPTSEQYLLPNGGLSDCQLRVDMPNSVSSAQPELPHQNSCEVPTTEVSDGSRPLLPNSVCQSGRKDHNPQDKVGAVLKPGKLVLSKQSTEYQLGTLGPLCREKRGISKSGRTIQERSKVSNLPSCTIVLNKMMRATNLKRKIGRAGGLCRWLSSLGLQQFVLVLRGKNVATIQLANLSMQKLKDMGFDAVGPRRKLIHAIECISHQND